MGKRNKVQKSEDTPTKKEKLNDVNLEEIKEYASSTSTSKQNRDKKKNKIPDKKLEVSDEDPELDNSPKQKRLKKGKKEEESNQGKVLDILDEDLKLDALVPQLERTGKKNKSKKEQSSSINSLTNSRSKKIVFVDDEPCKVPDSDKKTQNAPEKRRKFLNDDEAEVKDEDIDKFCDELTEEDNKEFENWVKLIEAKLHENKKSK